MPRSSPFGLVLAIMAAMLLTPDTLLVRLSGMDGYPLIAWRGIGVATMLLGLWAFQGLPERARLKSRAALILVACHALNGILFIAAFSVAPVAIVLFAVATVPVFSAIFGWIGGEAVPRITWAVIAAVLSGIAVAVFGSSDGGLVLDIPVLLGALAGLGSAAVLALSFVVIRKCDKMPIEAVVGLGSLLAALFGIVAVGGAGTFSAGDQLWPIVVSGFIILPTSFMLLNVASRHTPAANVSLLLLLETVLGPVWVWAVIGEAMTLPMIVGGTVVIASLLLYIVASARMLPSDTLH